MTHRVQYQGKQSMSIRPCKKVLRQKDKKPVRCEGVMLAWEKDDKYLKCTECGRMIRRVMKHRNRHQWYNGRWYRSGKEATFAQECDGRVEVDELERVEYEPRTVKLYVYGKHIGNYKPDFWLYYPNGRLEIVEVKGRWDAFSEFKWKLFEAIYNHEHPEIELTVVR